MTQESRLAIVIDTTQAKPSAEDLRRTMAALDDTGVRLTQTNAQVSKSFDSMSAQSSTAAATIRRGLVAVMGGLSVMKVVDTADSWGQYASRIRMATNSAEEYEHVQKRMAESARTTYRAIDETRESFIQMSPVLRDMGLSLDQSIDAVDTFSGLLVTNGANAQRGAAAMEALAKSFQRGRVDAQAWMTIYSTVDNIVEYIAETTGKTAAEIRQLGVDGKLSAAVLAQSLVDANQKVMKAVEDMPTTVRDALGNLNTAFTEYIGWKNEAEGATAAMASGINVLSENFETVATVIGVTAAGALTIYTSRMAGSTYETVKSIVQSRIKTAAELSAARAQAAQTQVTLAQTKAIFAQTGVQTNLTAAKIAAEAAEKRLTAAQVAHTGIGRMLLGVLGGPAGIIATAGIAATSFFLFRDSADEAARAAGGMKVDVDELAKSMSDLSKRQLQIKKFDLEEQVSGLEKEAKNAQTILKTMYSDLDAINNMVANGASISAKEISNVHQEIRLQEERVDELNGSLRVQQGVLGDVSSRLAELQASANGAAGAVNLLNREFTNDAGAKYLENLTDQAITAGLTSRRQQLDALVKAGKLAFTTKDLAEAQAAADKIDATSGAKKLSDGQKYIDQMIERIGLIGKETEAEKLLGQMSVGAIKFRNQGEYERAIQLAKVADQKQKEVDLELTLRDLRSQQSITQAQFMRELASFGQGDRVRELNADLAKVEDRYRGIIDARRNSPLGLSDDELARIRESLEVELGMVRDYHDKKLAITQDWNLGAQDALKNYSDEAQNVYRSLGDAVSGAFKGMEDSLVGFVKNGKLEFGDLADSIISDMIRIAIQQSVTGPLASAFGGWMGSLGGTGATALGAGTTVGGAGATAFPVSLWTGGYTGDGGKFQPAGIVHKGEGVLNQEEIRAIGGERGFNELRKAIRGKGHSMGGMGGAPSLPNLPGATATATAAPVINVTNKGTPQQVESASARWDGERWVLGIVMNDIRRNGPLGQMMRRGGV